MLSCIIPIFGDLFILEEYINDLMEDICDAAQKDTNIEFILVFDGPQWNVFVDLDKKCLNKNIVNIVVDEYDNPARLLNEGVKRANHDILSFAWIGCNLKKMYSNWYFLVNELSEETGIVCGRPSICESNRGLFQENYYPDSSRFFGRIYFGWTNIKNIVPMSNAVLNKTLFIQLMGFSEEEILKRFFWWEFIQRAAQRTEIIQLDLEETNCIYGWEIYPFLNMNRFSCDTVSRYINAKIYDTDEIIVKKPEWDFLHGKKITIISGYNDVAHNEICFINYFKKLVNTYNLNWRVVLENHCTYLDIIDSDIVIFSRSKTSNVKSVMDYCQVMKIPSIYMIDDNWVCIHKEWKEYENVIAPGTEIYDTFMYCIGKADITLLFNELLEQDLGDYAKRIFRTESNIDMQKGFCFKKSGKKDNIVLGYIGSHRTYTEPFQALSDILFKYNNTELVLMGTAIPKELENAPQNRIKHYPYIYDYQKYSNFVQNLKVDILIAPLGDTRFENSKCPNKYFEITSMGAVGIYSDIDIYRKYIKDGFNGFLCKNTLRDWKETIEMVINLRERYEAIFTNAVQDIKKKFDTQSRIDDFIKLLHMACQLVEERA